MVHRAKNLVKFRLEGLLLRGTGFRLILIAASIGVISVLAGTVVLFTEGGFDSPFQAFWWAFLRLSDPGYLGDDVGTVRRVVSTVLTVLGYVIFMGALVAIMIQWLNDTLRRLEAGYTPIASDDHVLVVGYTSRTTTILAEMLESEGRVQRFLRRHDAAKLRLVLLDDEVSAERRYELAERLGDLYDDRQIILRSGTPLRIEHLLRVAWWPRSTTCVGCPWPSAPTPVRSRLSRRTPWWAAPSHRAFCTMASTKPSWRSCCMV